MHAMSAQLGTAEQAVFGAGQNSPSLVGAMPTKLRGRLLDGRLREGFSAYIAKTSLDKLLDIPKSSSMCAAAVVFFNTFNVSDKRL